MKFLIIQTAFIGDVVLSTALAESLALVENAEVHYVVRKGNESLLENNPNIQNIPIRTEKGRRIRKAFVAGCSSVKLK